MKVTCVSNFNYSYIYLTLRSTLLKCFEDLGPRFKKFYTHSYSWQNNED